MEIRPEGYRETADDMEIIFQMKERKTPVRATVGAVDYVDGQAVWILSFERFMGVKGYVPADETGLDMKLVPRFVGQEVRVLIKGIDRESRILACSRKELVQKAQKDLPERLQAGDIIPVTVKAVLLDEERHSSLVADAGEGYLVEIPRAQAVRRLSAPLSRQYTVGQTVNAMVLATNPLAVSIRAALPDPWQTADFKRGQFISGTVYRVDKIVVIEPDLSPGLLGIAPIPVMGEVRKGMRVSCQVRNFSAQQKKLSLVLMHDLK